MTKECVLCGKNVPLNQLGSAGAACKNCLNKRTKIKKTKERDGLRLRQAIPLAKTDRSRQGRVSVTEFESDMATIPKNKEKPLWLDNSIQFPRLITEMDSFLDDEDIKAIAESMDLSDTEVRELIDRAADEFQKIKD